MASQAAERLIPSSMELGGKNAMIVLEDANLRRSLEGAEEAMFSNAGQLCISIERLFVHDDIADEFVGRLADRVRGTKVGAGLSYEHEMGSLISKKQLETVKKHVCDAVQKGATVFAGGRARPDLGRYFYEPTLLADVHEGMTLFADETFGPVVAVSTFSSEDEAVERANASRYGLNLQRLDAGRPARPPAGDPAAGQNGERQRGLHRGLGSIDAPMGGMKDSGIGRRHGATGIQKYTGVAARGGPATAADSPARPGRPSHLDQGDNRRSAAAAPARPALTAARRRRTPPPGGP